MSQSASQASIFYKEVEATGKIWSIKDNSGFPAPKNSSGTRSMPFWSNESRAQLIIKNIPAYKDFETVEIDLDGFYSWLRLLSKENQLAGINWSGKRAVGYDIEPETLINWLDSFKR